MSIWNDIRRRGLGIDIKQEDVFPCYLKFILEGNGTKLPKKFTVPSNIRVQRMLLIISTCELNGRLPQPKELITSWTFAWTYKVGERNIDELDAMLVKMLEEFRDLTYTIEDEKAVLGDRVNDFLEELKKRITEYNEGTCGIPIWTVDRFEI